MQCQHTVEGFLESSVIAVPAEFTLETVVNILNHERLSSAQLQAGLVHPPVVMAKFNSKFNTLNKLLISLLLDCNGSHAHIPWSKLFCSPLVSQAASTRKAQVNVHMGKPVKNTFVSTISYRLLLFYVQLHTTGTDKRDDSIPILWALKKCQLHAVTSLLPVLQTLLSEECGYTEEHKTFLLTHHSNQLNNFSQWKPCYVSCTNYFRPRNTNCYAILLQRGEKKSDTEWNPAKLKSPFSANTPNNSSWAILNQGPYPQVLMNYINLVQLQKEFHLNCFASTWWLLWFSTKRNKMQSSEKFQLPLSLVLRVGLDITDGLLEDWCLRSAVSETSCHWWSAGFSTKAPLYPYWWLSSRADTAVGGQVSSTGSSAGSRALANIILSALCPPHSPAHQAHDSHS